jgi:hypothetical protein
VIFFSAYAVIGLPEWFCRISGLSFCLETRIRLTVGIAGLLLAFVSLRSDGLALLRGRARLIAPLAVCVAVVASLWWLRGHNPAYLTPSHLLVCAAAASVLGSLYFCARGVVFAGALATVLVAGNFLVNPISEGLPILLRSEAAQRIATIHKSDPHAVWAVYEQPALAQLVVSSGARALTGIKSVPDLASMSRMDPASAHRDIYNRYSVVVFAWPGEGQEKPTFVLQGADWYRAVVSPFHSSMSDLALIYVVLPRPLSVAEMGSMELIDSLPQNSIWIYKLQPAPIAAPEGVVATGT